MKHLSLGFVLMLVGVAPAGMAGRFSGPYGAELFRAGGLPERIKSRVACIIERLGDWPEVSGAKPLRGEMAGHYRIRTATIASSFAYKARK